MLAPTFAVHAQTVNLGTADSFAVLAGTTVTNTGPTVIGGTAARPGDVGVSPGNAVVGFPPGILTGPGATFHVADALAIQAEIDLTTAYNTLAARPTTANLTGQNLGGLVLVPGVYSFNNAAQLTGALTLNGMGNPNAVFIFNIASTLTTSSASVVSLINGAQGGKRVLEGRQFGDARHNLDVHGRHLRERQHHPEYRRHDHLRCRLGKDRRGNAGHQYDRLV